MASSITDTMPIAIALAMGAIATEFVLPAGSPAEVAHELSLDLASLDCEFSPSPVKDDILAKAMPAQSASKRASE